MMKAEQEPEVEILDRYEGRSLAFPVFLVILAIIYDISPIDIIPDIPVVGYVDDFFITAAAVLNLLEKWSEETSQALSHSLRWFKWAVVFVGIGVVSLIALAALGIVSIFAL